MNNVAISIEVKEETVEVHVSVDEQRGYPLIPIIVVKTEDVVSFLENNNIAVGSLLKEGKAHNKRNHNRIGTWVFSKKTVDKKPKQVILKEEKPKTTRKRRTRATTKKKTSTEE